jgi:hypothetical protein
MRRGRNIGNTQTHVDILLQMRAELRLISIEAVLIACLAYSSTLNIAAVCSSETSVEFYRILHHVLVTVVRAVVKVKLSLCLTK